MYEILLKKIKKVGDNIHQFSGKAPDIGKAKPWLTEHDINTERELCDFIKKIDPDACFFAEEEHGNLTLNVHSLWVIDPISNTFNFIHGLPHYSICVSHMVAGEIIFSAVYDPSMKELFYAEKGKGSFLNDSKILVTKNVQDFSILIGPHLVPSNQKRSADVVKIIDSFHKIGTIRIIGSLGVQYAWVACGRADMAITLPKDIFPEMAGKLLVEEAGGKFTDFTGKSITLDSKNIIASNSVSYEIAQSIVEMTGIEPVCKR